MSFCKTFFFKNILSSLFILITLSSGIYFLSPVTQAHAQFAVFDAAVFGAMTVDDAEAATGDSLQAESDGEGFVTMLSDGVSAPANVGTSVATAISAQTSIQDKIKKFLLDPLARQLSRTLIKSLTAQTVNWINSGFNGNPAFITNPGQFFTNQADIAVSAALASQGPLFNQICSVFNTNVRLALATQYLQDARLGQCSIQGLIKGYNGFINNFANGGWSAWFQMTQSNSNNPYSSYFTAQNSLNLQIASKIQKYANQVVQGRGFLSWESCSANGDDTAALQAKAFASCNANSSDQQACVAQAQQYSSSDCSVQTPGSVIAGGLDKVTNSPIDQAQLANSIDAVVSALMTQGFKSIFGAAKGGLLGLSQPQNGQIAVTTNLASTTNADTIAGLNGIQSNLPTDIAGATGVNSTTTPTLPTLDISGIQAAAIAQAAAVQSSLSGQIPNSNVNAPKTISGTGSGYCGDGFCESGETAQSCPQDCNPGQTPGTTTQ
jgi:hypothetical protein